jgi:SAM-dependent methyltransferase
MSMLVFADYARYYNLFYRDKNYAQETAFVLGLLKQRGCVPRNLLDLGCGTGRHALEMVRAGVRVTGVDQSETMLALGRAELEQAARGLSCHILPDLHQGDARSVRLGKSFDAVSALFHVMSYQNTEADAIAVMETAKAHLKPGGLFLFDFWYGPGVLTEPPECRERIIEDERTRIHRVAQPRHRVEDNIVVVDYSVEITDIASGEISTIEESHSMRYWFLPELRYLSKQTGMKVFQEGAWLASNFQDSKTWNAWMLLSRGGM